ncbi:hypothetical protein SH668x_001576 [Planctomicrobium sp. SH668]|uniref:hypothetical protein n=1 Tax=Planctomicrobium sp. SH668 TaxID=3448126 RepID=UPI003F5B3BDE
MLQRFLHQFSTFAFLIIPVALATSGCGKSDGRKDLEIHGAVTFNDSPLEQGSIHFVSATSGESAYTNLNSDGTYVLNFKNAKAGEKYLVKVLPDAIVAMSAADAGNIKPSKIKIPQKYQSADSSGLEVLIGDDSKVKFDVAIKK